MPLVREEFEEWKEHHVTKAFMKRLRADLENMKDMLIEVDPTDLENLQGRCKVVQSILDVQYEDMFE